MRGALSRQRRIPLAVLVLVLLLSVFTALLLNHFVVGQQDARFGREVSAYTASLRNRLSDYDNLLRAARSFWQVQGGPDQATFSAYVDQLGLEQRYPGVLAVGFVRWVQGPDGAAHAPVGRIAPLTAVNRTALGFDMMSEPCRRAAILRARDRGDLQSSCPVKLVQRGPRGEQLDGLLLLLPVREGSDLRGLMYLALRTDHFLTGLTPPDAMPGVDVRTLLNGEVLGTPDAEEHVSFRGRTSLKAAGGDWELAFSAPGSFGRDAVAEVPVVVLVAGLLVAGLAFLLTQAQVRARERAEEASRTLVESRVRLEQSRAEFEAIFQSIQDAAAFADAGGRVRLVNRALTEQFG